MQVILFSFPGIKGEVTISGYEGQIALESFDMNSAPAGARMGSKPALGQTNMGAPPTGQAHNAGGASADGVSGMRLGIDSITLRKSVDVATPSLIKRAFSSEPTRTETPAIITVFRAHEKSDSGGVAGGGKIQWHEPFLVMKFGEPRIAGHSMNIGKDSLGETVQLGFKTLDITYTVYRNGQRFGCNPRFINLAE